MTSEDPFTNMANQFGGLESTMGQDAYQGNVEHVKSMTRVNDAIVKSADTRADCMRMLFTLLMFWGTPAVIFLWVYLFKLWVI